MDLLGMHRENYLRTVNLTILHRPGHGWSNVELSRLVNGLNTLAHGHPSMPEYVILEGHFTKEQSLAAILGGIAFTVTRVRGIESKELPFVPRLIQP